MNKISLVKKIYMVLVLIFIGVGCLACSSSTASFNYESAQMQFNKGNYEEAKKYIDKAVKAKKNKAEYLILAGHIYSQLDDMDKALELFDSAIIESDKVVDLENNKDAYRGKGIVYFEKQKYDKAINEFDTALNIDANVSLDKDILKYKIDALNMNKEYKDAIKLGNIYMENFGEDNYIYILQGHGYANLDDEKNMKKKIDKAISNGEVDGYYHLAKCYFQLKKYKEAIDNYEIFIDKNSQINKEPIYLGMINCLINSKEYDKALSIARDNSKSNNKEYSKVFKKNVVGILEKQGNFDDAYVEAKEYLAEYTDDKEMEKEVSFLETRIIK